MLQGFLDQSLVNIFWLPVQSRGASFLIRLLDICTGQLLQKARHVVHVSEWVCQEAMCCAQNHTFKQYTIYAHVSAMIRCSKSRITFCCTLWHSPNADRQLL